MNQNRALLGFVALGLAGSAASAQAPYLINGSGATLLEAFFTVPASTNDFIDADGDGSITGVPPGNVDQLAPDQFSTTSFPPDTWWHFTYRVVGSVNGFQELRDWGFTYATAGDNNAANNTLNSSFSDRSVWNRTNFALTGLPVGTFYNFLNAGGNPVRALPNAGGRERTTTSTTAPNGVGVSLAAIDVPVLWSTIKAGAPKFNAVPTTPGYGDNPRSAVNADGTVALDPVTSLPQDNKLASLIGFNGPINTNISSPDTKTVFDTALTLTPVAAMVNFGAGLQQIQMSDLRHLNTTGRRLNGENLVCVTRDSGSGTRNAFMNGIGLDPSWGVGENTGPRTVSSANDRLGPNFTPSNKGSSGRLEGTVRNHRLALGHTGAERGQSAGWILRDGNGNQIADVLAVQADIKGGTTFARPNFNAVIDGGVNGYNITGPGVIATLGAPRAAEAVYGGWGWAPGETGPYTGPGAGFPPANRDTAAYVNNITRSIAAFVNVPASANNVGTPGEYLAEQFLLNAAPQFVPENNPAPSAPFIGLVPNPDFNAGLNAFLNNPATPYVLKLTEYQSFNTNTAGKVPTRTTGVAYSDATAPGGSPTGQNYVNQGGAAVTYGSDLNRRNTISGDFNGDGARTSADLAEMLKAYRSRNGGPVWVAPNGTGPIAGFPGTAAIIEVLGDFDGNGSFDKEDIRYWADGLGLSASGNVDRQANFTAVDVEWQALTGNCNFFGTTWASGAPYTAGDSRFDVSRPSVTGGTFVVARGYRPNGSDGIIGADDIAYVNAQFNQPGISGAANWNNTAEAALFDLSADMDGDLDVDGADAAAIQPGNGSCSAGCYADCDGNGSLNIFDYICFGNAYSSQQAYADCDGNGSFNIFDYICFGNAYSAGCP